MRCGFLPVLKPAGPSSAAMVAALRRATGLQHCGHTGTLDPAAEGVLVIAFGPATGLIPYLPGEKTYQACIRFGQTTDTLDAQGNLLQELPVPELSEARLQALFSAFVGRIEQVPPLISARHFQGRRLYALARAGHNPPRQSRTVMIHELKILAVRREEVDVEVTCSAGTYIRTLAADAGERLGCGAHLQHLRRLRANGFTLSQSWESRSAISWQQRAIAPAAALAHLPEIRLSPGEVSAVRHGQRLPPPPDAGDGLVRLLDPCGQLVAVGRVTPLAVVLERVLPDLPEEVGCAS